VADTADIALVRLYIADLTTDPADYLLTDGQLGTLIDGNAGNTRLAAADALEAIAASEVLVSKKIRTQTLTTDGPAVSAELRALAQRHRDIAAGAAAAVADAEDVGFLDVVDTIAPCTRPEHTNYEVWGL
jgi:hypothetical protein